MYNNAWKEFVLRNINQKYYCSNYYDVLVKYGVKCGTSIKFWEKKDGFILLTHMVGFIGVLDIG